MDPRLKDAAQTGDIDAIYTLLRENPFVLDYNDQFPFVVTPLHIAVSHGKTRFAMAFLRFKPSFTRKLNEDGFSPIHLASTNGNVEMVRKFIYIDHDLYLLKGREGRTPLHCATIAGKIDVIKELLSTCPESLVKKESLVLTDDDETALDLAVKNNQLEAFQVLLVWLKDECKLELLKRKDEKGDTILHLATSANKLQVVQALVNINNNFCPLDMHMKNASGLTALAISQQQLLSTSESCSTWQIERMLRNESRHTSPISIFRYKYRKTLIKRSEATRNLSNEVRNALLVVFVLIATFTYQAALYPPGGVWQDTKPPTIINNSTNPIKEQHHFAGQVILDSYLYTIFIYFNSIGFCISVYIIAILTVGSSVKYSVLGLLFSVMCTYLGSIIVILPRGEENVLNLKVIAPLIPLIACYVSFTIYMLLTPILVTDPKVLLDCLNSQTEIMY